MSDRLQVGDIVRRARVYVDLCASREATSYGSLGVQAGVIEYVSAAGLIKVNWFGPDYWDPTCRQEEPRVYVPSELVLAHRVNISPPPPEPVEPEWHTRRLVLEVPVTLHPDADLSEGSDFLCDLADELAIALGDACLSGSKYEVAGLPDVTLYTRQGYRAADDMHELEQEVTP